MTGVERVVHLNRWYDGLSSEWRFQFILWPFIALGAINLLLTMSAHFPFGLLVLIGFLGVAAVRVPYRLAHPAPHDPVVRDGDSARRVAPPWVIDCNQRYEAMSEFGRIWLITAILGVAGIANMLLTIGGGFPFGLLFLVVLLAMLAVRAPYANGWVGAPRAASDVAEARLSGPADRLPTEAQPAVAVGPQSPSLPSDFALAGPMDAARDIQGDIQADTPMDADGGGPTVVAREMPMDAPRESPREASVDAPLEAGIEAPAGAHTKAPADAPPPGQISVAEPIGSVGPERPVAAPETAAAPESDVPELLAAPRPTVAPKPAAAASGPTFVEPAIAAQPPPRRRRLAKHPMPPVDPADALTQSSSPQPSSPTAQPAERPASDMTAPQPMNGDSGAIIPSR